MDNFGVFRPYNSNLKQLTVYSDPLFWNFGRSRKCRESETSWVRYHWNKVSNGTPTSDIRGKTFFDIRSSYLKFLGSSWLHARGWFCKFLLKTCQSIPKYRFLSRTERRGVRRDHSLTTLWENDTEFIQIVFKARYEILPTDGKMTRSKKNMNLSRNVLGLH